MTNLENKLNLLTSEQKRAYSRFERCYEREYEDTPEHMRNDVSGYNDRIIIELLRLGGVTGNPRGLYPAQIVSQIWDVAIDSEPIRYQSVAEADYFKDLDKFIERTAGQKMLEFEHEYRSEPQFERQRILLFDTGRANVHPLKLAIAIHHLSPTDIMINNPDLFDSNSKRDLQDMILRSQDIVKGRYMVHTQDNKYTEGLQTRVVLLDYLNGPKKSTRLLEEAKKDPFFSEDFLFMIYSKVNTCDDLSFENWLEQNQGKDAFTQEQQDFILDESKSIMESANKDLAICEKMRLQFLNKPGYIFVTSNGEILAYGR